MTPIEITAARCARGWTRAELARRAGLHASDVGKIEAGKLQPYPSQLERIEAALSAAEE